MLFSNSREGIHTASPGVYIAPVLLAHMSRAIATSVGNYIAMKMLSVVRQPPSRTSTRTY